MEAGINTPEFLQKKVDRLKRALEEANSLMDRQVQERDEARAQVSRLQEELARIRASLAAGDVPAPGADPGVPAGGGAAGPEAEEMAGRLQALEDELERSRAELDSTRRELDDARSRLVNAEAAAAAPPGAPVIASSAQHPPESAVDLATPGGGPFVDPAMIRRALAEDGFVLFCQPVFSLTDERITQYELLLRMKDDQGRLLRPFAFLEPADRYGLMAEIDRWVVGTALDLLTADAGGELRLEVNIAGQSLADPELTALIEQQIAVTDLDPSRLILEVSENVAVANLEACESFAKRLRGMGCAFALDDFGSTFASFRHLRNLPLNYIKLDGDLVVTVVESRTGQLTIKSLVDLANGMGAETIAEYVSDDQTLEFLREQGVGYAQGYRIGRPRPLEEVLGTADGGTLSSGEGGGPSESAGRREAAARRPPA